MHHARHALLILLSALAIAWATPSTAQVVVVRITTPPPPLPVYVQPVIPGPDYFWAPGYWCWGPDGYYWVPGTWVLAPAPGLLWTPGYWAWRENIYVWHAGYWGPRVGFYGGVNYGFGYPGVGFHGGYWNGGGLSFHPAGPHLRPVQPNQCLPQDRRPQYNGDKCQLQRRQRRHQRQAECGGPRGRQG